MNNARLLLAASLLLTACDTPDVDPNLGEAIGRCMYNNGITGDFECKEYYGSNWTEDAILDNCAAPTPGAAPGLFEPGLACDRSVIRGECVVDPGTVEAATIVFLGDDPNSCSDLSIGCGFAGGEFVPAAACGGTDPFFIPDFGPFTQPELVCVDPLPSEPPGLGPDGQVCTWEAISASTEPGRRYLDYASCEPVLTQRPYWSNEVSADTPDDDPRYDDAAWMDELDWVTSEVEASACVCCHSVEAAPNGETSGWSIEAEGLWIDTLDDDAMAMMAGWIDSTSFGAYAPEHNNGFAREITGMPSSQPQRMKDFLEGELARRGFVEADFADERPFGGPLADQLVFEPDVCTSGDGVDASGRVHWSGGRARYVYVLEAWAENPMVPPNLDRPEGTLWRLDVARDELGVESGIAYGATPPGSVQQIPEGGGPAELVPGQDYYLYVTADVGEPITRCLFEAR